MVKWLGEMVNKSYVRSKLKELKVEFWGNSGEPNPSAVPCTPLTDGTEVRRISSGLTESRTWRPMVASGFSVEPSAERPAGSWRARCDFHEWRLAKVRPQVESLHAYGRWPVCDSICDLRWWLLRNVFSQPSKSHCKKKTTHAHVNLAAQRLVFVSWQKIPTNHLLLRSLQKKFVYF